MNPHNILWVNQGLADSAGCAGGGSHRWRRGSPAFHVVRSPARVDRLMSFYLKRRYHRLLLAVDASAVRKRLQPQVVRERPPASQCWFLSATRIHVLADYIPASSAFSRFTKATGSSSCSPRVSVD